MPVIRSETRYTFIREITNVVLWPCDAWCAPLQRVPAEHKSAASCWRSRPACLQFDHRRVSWGLDNHVEVLSRGILDELSTCDNELGCSGGICEHSVGCCVQHLALEILVEVGSFL